MKIFYSHHLYKYGTKIEEMEIRMIKEQFPDAEIFNPATDIDQNMPTENIMQECVKQVNSSDVVVFSTLSGLIGKGCFTEISEAFRAGIPLFVISGNSVVKVDNFSYHLTKSGNNREYAVVSVNENNPS